MSAGRVMVVIVNWHDWDSTRAAIESIYRGVGPVLPQVLTVVNEQQEHPPALPDGVMVVTPGAQPGICRRQQCRGPSCIQTRSATRVRVDHE